MSQPYTPAGTVGTSLTEMTDAEATGTFGDQWGQDNVRTTGNKIRFLNDAGTLGTGIYESGTWTPGKTGFTEAGGGSYALSGTYRKIQGFVLVTAVISCSGGATIAASAGSSRITGLPFASAADAAGGWVDGTTTAASGGIQASGTSMYTTDGWSASSDVRIFTAVYPV
jgi:hypothetical protein